MIGSEGRIALAASRIAFAPSGLSWQDLPSRLRRSVMSADFVSLEMNLLRRFEPHLSNKKRKSRSRWDRLFSFLVAGA